MFKTHHSSSNHICFLFLFCLSVFERQKCWLALRKLLYTLLSYSDYFNKAAVRNLSISIEYTLFKPSNTTNFIMIILFNALTGTWGLNHPWRELNYVKLGVSSFVVVYAPFQKEVDVDWSGRQSKLGPSPFLNFSRCVGREHTHNFEVVKWKLSLLWKEDTRGPTWSC